MVFRLLLFFSFVTPIFLLASNDISIETTSGMVYAKKTKNVLVYEDIPYAQPPIGNLRWKAPKK